MKAPYLFSTAMYSKSRIARRISEKSEEELYLAKSRRYSAFENTQEQALLELIFTCFFSVYCPNNLTNSPSCLAGDRAHFHSMQSSNMASKTL